MNESMAIWPLITLSLCLVACISGVGMMWAKKIEPNQLDPLMAAAVILVGVSLLGIFYVLQPWQWALLIGVAGLLIGAWYTSQDVEANGWALLIGAVALIGSLIAWAVLTARDALANVQVSGIGHLGGIAMGSPLVLGGIGFVVTFLVMWIVLENKSRAVESGAHAAERPHGMMAGVSALTAGYIAFGGYLLMSQSGDWQKFGLLLAGGAVLGFFTVLTGYMASTSYGKAGSTSKVSLFDSGVFAVGVGWLRIGAFVWPVISAAFTWWKP